MIKNAKDLRGESLPDLIEKRLIIARYFINQKNNDKEFCEKDIYYMWNNYFPSDFRISKNRKLKLKEGKHYSQLVLLEHSANIDENLIKNYSNKWQKNYCWILKYVKNHSLKECDTEILNHRKEQYKELIRTFKPLKYYVKNTSAKPSDCRVATYNIFKGNTNRSGSFDSLMKYADGIKESTKNGKN